MELLLTLAGVALIAVALRDIFETLFHPTARGVLSDFIARAVWNGAHRLPGTAGGAPRAAGPVGYILVLAGWTTMLVIGWALIFWPHMPEGFNFSGGLEPADHESFVDALYVSLVNLTSLGYGDISPAAPGLRILGPVETLFGLGLLTASISWLVSIHAALIRRETLTREVHLMREAEQRLGERLAVADPALLGSLIAGVSVQLIAVRRDLIHQPVTHYFQSAQDRAIRDDLRGFLRDLVEQGKHGEAPPALRLRAEILAMALDDFEETLAGHW